MVPQTLRSGYGQNNMAHYQFNAQMGSHNGNLAPTGSNASFMTSNTLQNPFNNSLPQQGYTTLGGGLTGQGLGLASQNVQASFHGAAPLNQSAAGSAYDGSRTNREKNKAKVREVWKGNLAEEMVVLRELIDKYPYVAMDTQFPGLVARPMGNFRGKSDYHYQTLRVNIDMLKLIQLGITLFDDEGKLASERPQTSDNGVNSDPATRYSKVKGQCCTWQFNFQFSLEEDMCAENWVESTKRAGVDFQKHATDGIDPFEFGSLLQTSGLICFDDVHWVSFHGAYDFGYLTKLMMRQPLPVEENEFDQMMHKFFPSSYDVKYLMKQAAKNHSLGQHSPLDSATLDILNKFEAKPQLDSLAESFRVDRIGRHNNAGSDSYVSGKVFWELRRRIYDNNIPEESCRKVWGLKMPEGHPQMSSAANQAYNSHENGLSGTNLHNGPSTPNNAHAGLANLTPLHQSHGMGGPSTPGGYGHFQQHHGRV